MRNLDLDALQIFKAVVDQGGVARAAAQLNRVQSNVTTRVKQLEERLGTRLFERQKRRLVLSAEGRLLLSYAERLLALSSEAQAALRAGAPRGPFRLGTLESTAATRLPPILARYHRKYPDVQIELVTGTTGALLDRVRNFEIEAAFVAVPQPAPELETLPVFTEELVLIGARDAPRMRTPADVGQRTLIAFAAGCSYRRLLEEWIGAPRAAPHRVMEFGSYHAIIACVAAGAGVAIVPRAVVHALRAESDIALWPLPARFAKARTHLVWRRGQPSLALDALIKELPRGAARRPAPAR